MKHLFQSSIRWPAALALLLCVAALVGWYGDVPLLTRAVPGWPTMTVQGAFGFGLVSLAMAAGHRLGRIAHLVLLATAAAVALTPPVGLEVLLAAALLPDAALPPGTTPLPLMAASTAACLLMLAVSAALAGFGTQARRLGVLLAMASLVLAYVGSMGLITELRWSGWGLYLFGRFSLPLAAVVLLLGIAALDLHGAPSVRVAVAVLPGHRFARAVLPLALLIPVASAWMADQLAASLGWAAPLPQNAALIAAGVLFALLVTSSGRWIASLESAVEHERATLERRVVERTEALALVQAREQALREHLDDLLDRSDVAVVVIDRTRIVRRWNLAAARLFARESSSMLAAPCPPELLPAPVLDTFRVWCDGGSAASGPREMPIAGAVVPDLPAEIVTSALSAPEPCFTVAIRDLRPARALEAARTALARQVAAGGARASTLSAVSHDLRTPLNAILGFGQLLTAEAAVAEQPRLSRFVRLIVEAGRGMVDLLDDLSDLGRSEAGQLRLQLQPVRLAPVVVSCLEQMQPLAEVGRIDCRWVGGEADTWSVNADPVRLRRVLQNLVGNAIKYNRPGGRVVLSAQRRGSGQIALFVDDDGLGMDAAQQADAFAPFARAGRENSGIPGTGLGLAIVQTLVQAMQGEVGVSSTPGVGSRFTVVLPEA